MIGPADYRQPGWNHGYNQGGYNSSYGYASDQYGKLVCWFNDFSQVMVMDMIIINNLGTTLPLIPLDLITSNLTVVDPCVVVLSILDQRHTEVQTLGDSSVKYICTVIHNCICPIYKR